MSRLPALLGLLPALVLALPAQAAPASPLAVPLVDGDGRPFTLGALRGRWTWLYLGYAQCPDACPLGLSEIAEAYANRPAGALVQGVFVSVDPLRDTPARLKTYVSYFDKSFIGATGTRADLDALTAALGTRFEVPANAKPDGVYQVGHPNEVFVLDPWGRLVGRVDLRGEGASVRLKQDLVARLAAPPDVGTEPVPPPSTSAAWCGLPTEAVLDDPDPLRDPRMHRAATMASGTAVLPGTTPMRMWATKGAGWLWMAHALAAPGRQLATGPRGQATPTFENWAMAMGSRYWGPGLLDLRVMGSLEPWTMPLGGTPQLFQAGETWQGRHLVDAQHPHDLLMDLSARYTWTPDPRLSLFGYGAVVGEPALGPAAYMHRPSAADNLWAPLGHHLQDAAHISHGVVTAGARLFDVQAEASLFNGREPDEDRVGLDMGPLDAWSARLSWFPGRNLSAQVSHGLLRQPEPDHPGDLARTTASLTAVAGTPLGRWATSLIWGQNTELMTGMPAFPMQSYGLESQLDWRGRQHAYTRFELVDRAGLPPFPVGSHSLQRVGALTLGYTHDIGPIDRWALAVGADATAYSLEPFTRGAYGDNPVAFRAFLRLRPPTSTHPDDVNPAADGP